MASKVNTKFVTILALTLFAGVAAVGGTLYWVLKNDATRLVRKGDEAVAAGDLKAAERLYAKAVNKRQTDGPLLKKWGDTLQQITPDTQTEYIQRYGEFVNMLRSYSVLQQSDVGAHSAYLDVIYKEVIFSRYNRQSHDNLIDATDKALGYFARGEVAVNGTPDTLRRYRGIARAMIIAQAPDQVERKAAEEALADLDAAIKADPADEPSLNAIVVVLSAKAITARKGSIDLEAATVIERARAAVTSFLINRPDSPSVQLSALELDLDEAARAAVLGKSGGAAMTAAKEKRALFVERLDPIAESLKKVGPLKVEPNTLARFMIAESIIDPASKRSRVESVLRDFIVRQPDDFFAMQLLGDLLAERGDTDGAIATLQKIVELPKRKLGVEGLLLQQLQPTVIGKQARFTMLAWERSKPEDRLAALTKAKELAATFRVVAGDVPAVMLLDAQIKFGEGDLGGSQRLLQTYNASMRDEDPDGLWLMAQVMIRNNSSGSTEKLIEKVVKLQPGNLSAHVALAEVKIRLQKFDEAIGICDTVLQMDPSNASAKNLKLGVEAARGENPLIENDPVRQAIGTAQQLVLAEKNVQAIELLRKALIANKFDHRVAIFLAQQLNFTGDKPAALAVIEETIKNNPAAEGPLTNTKIGLEAKDPMHAELAAIAAMNAKPMENFLMQATIYRKYGKKAESDTALIEAAKIDPEDSRLIELQFLQGLENKDFAACAKFAEKAESRDLDRVGGRTFRARLLFAQGQFGEAISIMQNAANEFALTPDTWRVLARMQVQAGRGIDATASYNQALAMRPDDVTMLIEYIVLLQSMNRVEDALELARTNQKYGQNNSQFSNLLLDLEGQRGDKAKALGLREKMLERTPNDLTNRLAIAWLLLDLQQFDKARKQIDDLRKESPDSLEPLILDARYSADRGDFNNSRNLFAIHIAGIPRDKLTSEPYIAFARMMFQYEQNEGALTTLDQGRRYQDPATMEADRIIADQCTRLRLPLAAEAALRRILAGKADTADQTYTRRLVENLNAQKKFSEAQQFLTTLTLSPDKDVVTLLLAADTARGLNDDKKSQELLDRAKSAFASDARVWVKSAQSNMRRPELAGDAEADLNRAIQLEPKNAQLYEIRGGFYISQGKTTEGIADLQQAVGFNPGLATLRLTLMRELIRRDRSSEARSLGEEAIKSRGNDVQLSIDMADVFTEAKQHAFAARFYKSAWDLNKTPALTHRYLDSLLSAEPPMLSEAERVLKDRAAEIERSPELRLARARLQWRRGRMDEVRKDLKGALDLVPTDRADAMMTWYNDLGRIYSKPGERSRQLDQFEKEATGEPTKVWLMLLRGMALAEDAATRTQGQEVLKQVLPRAKIEETRILCYQQLAIAYYLADQYNESVEVLKRGLAEFPDDWELNNNLAFTLATHLGRAKDALEPAERAAAIRPTNVDSLDTLGTVYLLAGDLDKAEQVLRKAVVAGGRLIGQTSAMIHLCKTMLAKKDIPAARKIFDDLNQLAKSVSSEMPADQKKELEAIRTQLDSPQNR